MERRRFLLTSLGGVFAAPRAARAQQAGRIWRIGVLDAVDATAANLSEFRRGLRELGYLEGQNVVIQYRSADSRPAGLSDVALELVRLNPDAIVTSGDAAALAAKRATEKIPIVMAWSADPTGIGVVASLARPGGNVTGFHSWASPTTSVTRLEMLKEIMPGLSRVAVFWNSGDLYTHLVVTEMEKAATALGAQLILLDVPRPWQFEQAFEAALLSRPDALVVVEDSYLMLADRGRIVDRARIVAFPQ